MPAGLSIVGLLGVMAVFGLIALIIGGVVTIVDAIRNGLSRARNNAQYRHMLAHPLASNLFYNGPEKINWPDVDRTVRGGVSIEALAREYDGYFVKRRERLSQRNFVGAYQAWRTGPEWAKQRLAGGGEAAFRDVIATMPIERDRDLWLETHLKLSDLLVSRGDTNECIDVLESGLRAVSRERDRAMFGRMHSRLANALAQLGDATEGAGRAARYRDAIAHFHLAIETLDNPANIRDRVARLERDLAALEGGSGSS